MTDSTETVSRRAILAGLGTAGVAGLLPDAAPAAEATPWTHSADIVCVGSGAAALSAAITAYGNGDKVIVVEKMPVVGGTTAKSGGVHWIPNNYLLKDKGITDAKADCLRYMARFSDSERYRPDSPTLGLSQHAYDLLEAFYDNAAPAIDRLRSMGAYKSCEFTIASWLAKPELKAPAPAPT
jgi:succinate dehydrogenase/fumarate reductase flavoprotein subunit